MIVISIAVLGKSGYIAKVRMRPKDD